MFTAVALRLPACSAVTNAATVAAAPLILRARAPLSISFQSNREKRATILSLPFLSYRPSALKICIIQHAQNEYRGRAYILRAGSLNFCGS